jgi:hypothetical protein
MLKRDLSRLFMPGGIVARQRNILGNQLFVQNRETNASAAGSGYSSYPCIVKIFVTDV